MKTQGLIRASSTAAFAVRSGGFTLIELLVTISIAAIMVAVALPSFTGFTLDNRLASQSNDFVLALTYAKSEAINRGLTVTVCSRSTDTACAGSTTWDNGWLVFVDNNGDGTVNGTDLLLQVRAPLEGGNTLRAGARKRVTFQDTGFSMGFNDTFRLCDSRGAASGKSIVVSMQGRASTSTGVTGCP